jgi:hypothetical protein
MLSIPCSAVETKVESITVLRCCGVAVLRCCGVAVLRMAFSVFFFFLFFSTTESVAGHPITQERKATHQVSRFVKFDEI